MAYAVQHEFAPPPPRGLGLALVLALLAHGFLALILTAGVQWKRSAPQQVAFEAELWAAVPTQAAPPAPLDVPEEATPTTPPLPPVPAEPKAPPAPVVKTPAPDITLAREKERLKKEELQRQELEKQKLERLKLEKEKAAKDKAEKERAAKEKLAKEKDRQRDDKQIRQEAAKREQEEIRKIEEMRQQNLKRIAGMAASGGGNGDARSTGTAAQNAAPSAGYAGRVRARVKPNIVFTDNLTTNPTTEVEVRTAPDGTIIGTRIVQSSGVKAWDDAVLKALEKTEVLPKDTDGRVPTPMIMSFRPRDN